MSNGQPLADLIQRVTAFTGAVGDLSTEVETLGKEVKDLDKRSGRHTGWITLDIALSVATILMGFVLGGEVDSNRELVVQQQAIVEDLKRSMRNQCAQLAIFLGSYRPESRPPEQRDEYERNFANFRFQFKDLNCDPATITSPIPTPTPAPSR